MVLGFISAILLNQFTLYIGLICGIVFYYFTKNNDFFERHGVPYEKPSPFLGSIKSILFKKQNYYEYYEEVYSKSKYQNVGFFGVFEFTKPLFVLRDPDLVKQICIKDFDAFPNHRLIVDANHDPILSRNLFSVKDNRWREMRNMMSPAFTGAKMRFLFSSTLECVQNIKEYMLEEAKKNVNGIYEFEALDLFTRCSTDIIGSTAFGIQINSVKERDNEFYDNGKKIGDFKKFARILVAFIYLNIPKLGVALGLRLLDKNITDYFKEILLNVMSMRETNKTSRPDIVQFLLEAKAKGHIENEGENEYLVKTPTQKQANTKWTDDDFVAQSVVFFLAGFETASNLFSFMTYELALNPDVQNKLIEEIDQVLLKLNGKKIDYESLHKMKYLDMVVQEALRINPPNVGVDRVVNRKYTLQDKSGLKVVLEPGDTIWIPVIGFHRDPKYFPNPNKFDPERFSEENKSKIDTGAYQPFGMGPRMCIGNRFALMEAKCLLFEFLSCFKVVPYEKTEIPLNFIKGTLGRYSKNGIWLHFKVRK